MTSAERSMRLPAELMSVRHGRIFARDVVREWGLERLADDVQLGVSELITNAVRHAGTEVVLALRLDGDLLVEVQDEAPDAEELTIGAIDVEALSGRGLLIVSAISSDWGVSRRADGKSVWFRLQLPDSGTADADVFSMQQHRDESAPARPRADGRGDAQEMQARAAS
jgi:anti-sigma regulatory factor (Ser/Thr protein kinase)